MTRRYPILLIALVSLTWTASLPAFAPHVELRAGDAWDKPISMDLKQAEIKQVLELVFQLVDQPAAIDGCVEGTVSLKFENVALRDALESIARTGDLRVRPMREGYRVDCGADRECAAPAAEGHLLEFTLTNLLDGGLITRPSLQVRYDSLAEIQVGTVQPEDLDPAGEFFPGQAQPSFRLKAYLVEDKTDAHSGTLRGVFEMAVRDRQQPRTMRMAVHSFEIELPVGSSDVRVIELGLGEERYELTVSRSVRR